MAGKAKVEPHPFYKTGLQKPRPDEHQGSLSFKAIWKGTMPVVPLAANHLAGTSFGLYNNDKWGICGPTAVANLLRLIGSSLRNAGLPVPTQDDVNALYKLCNPDWNPETGEGDNGVEMQDMLEKLLAHGIAGHKPLFFAQVDVSSDEDLAAAIAIFGGLLWGVNLQVSQQDQTDANPPIWNYQRTRTWGGHAVLAGAYSGGWEGTADLEVVESWAMPISTTDSFRRKQLAEAWLVVWPEQCGTEQFLQNIDQSVLVQATKSLTGKVLVIPTPSPVTPPLPVSPDPVEPTPSPEPAPDPEPVQPGAEYIAAGPFSDAEMVILRRRAGKKSLSVAQYVTSLLQKSTRKIWLLRP